MYTVVGAGKGRPANMSAIDWAILDDGFDPPGITTEVVVSRCPCTSLPESVPTDVESTDLVVLSTAGTAVIG